MSIYINLKILMRRKRREFSWTMIRVLDRMTDFKSIKIIVKI